MALNYYYGLLPLRPVFLLAGLLLAGLAPSTTQASPVKRSVDFRNPCSPGGGEAALPNIEVVVEDLRAGTDGLKHLSNTVKDQSASILTNMGLTTMMQTLNKAEYSFIKPLPTGGEADEALRFIKDPKAVLLSHWSHLYNLTSMVHHARMDGNLGESEFDDNFDDANLRNSLDTLEARLDAVMCNVYVGLRVYGVLEPTTPDFQFTLLFKDLTGSFKKEVYRVYRLALDVYTVAQYLNTVYTQL